MKVHTKTVLSHLCIMFLPVLQACAQPGPQEQIWQAEQIGQPGQIGQQTARIFSQQELDQMLAPIALYPDALLSQILMAATYPLLYSLWVPWQVVIDNQCTKLEIDTFSRSFSGNHNFCFVIVITTECINQCSSSIDLR